jgi:DNA-binding NtrC family response regulator
MQKILIVDDEAKIRTIVSQILTDEGYTVETASGGDESVKIAGRFRPDLVLMDQNMPDISGIEAMTRIKENIGDVTVIMLTAYGSIELAVEAMKKGAYDYLTKPFDNDELLLIILRALERSSLAREVTTLKRQLRDKYRFESIIGVSPQMQQLYEQMQRVCDTTATVLVQGESGTGKELVAKALHFHSSRKNKPIVSVNCGAIPINLIESELFGHEKGAFTDAREQKIGTFEKAQGGTLLLDEIGELPLDAQVKLLRVLEDRRVTRVGGGTPIDVDVRIISITNKDLQKEVDAGMFRLDLLYRLNIFTLIAPPLRERRQDIPLLVEHFIEKHNRLLGLSVENVSETAIQALVDCDWPGNVRDLENAVQSAMILAGAGILGAEDLPLRVRGYSQVGEEREIEQIGLVGHVKKITSDIEREVIETALAQFGGNRSRTAEHLRISRKTLFNKMQEYDISQ